MSSILTRSGLLRADQVAHLALGHFQRHRLAGQLAVRQQAVERAFEIAAIMGDGLGDEASTGVGTSKPG